MSDDLKSQQLDNVDREILDLLSVDGRISASDIAAKVGLSRPAVSERIEKLEHQGMIQGYVAVVRNYPIHTPVTAFVAARHPGYLAGKAEEAVYALAKKKEVLEVHGVAGQDCLYLKVRAEDMQDLNRLLRELQEPPLLMETRTTIVLSTYFEKVGGVLLHGEKKR